MLSWSLIGVDDDFSSPVKEFYKLACVSSNMLYFYIVDPSTNKWGVLWLIEIKCKTSGTPNEHEIGKVWIFLKKLCSPRMDHTRSHKTPNPSKHHGTPYPISSSQLKHT